MASPRPHNESDRQLTINEGDMAASVVFDIIKDRLPPSVTLADFLKHAKKYSFVPVVADGAIVGAYANCGPELHAAVRHEYRGKWFSKRVIRWIGDLHVKYGKLTTKVARENAAGHNFVRRVGFAKVGETPFAILYEKEAA